MGMSHTVSKIPVDKKSTFREWEQRTQHMFESRLLGAAVDHRTYQPGTVDHHTGHSPATSRNSG